MGYYTKYSIEVRQEEENEQELQEIYEYRLPIGGASVGELTKKEYEAKWYEHDEDMNKLSLTFPTTLFILQGKRGR